GGNGGPVAAIHHDPPESRTIRLSLVRERGEQSRAARGVIAVVSCMSIRKLTHRNSKFRQACAASGTRGNVIAVGRVRITDGDSDKSLVCRAIHGFTSPAGRTTPIQRASVPTAVRINA